MSDVVEDLTAAARVADTIDHVLEFERPPLYDKQYEAIYDPRRYSIIEASTKAGKAQPLDALIYTPDGPMLMGQMQVGQTVLTPDGTAAVVGVHPQGLREIFKVTFSDGAEVEVDGDHLWEVHQFRAKPVLVTTRELMSWKSARLARAWVPPVRPVAFSAQPVTADPYLLGVLIGDGGLRGESVMLSTADREILDEVAKAVPSGHTLRKSTGHDYAITAGSGAAVLRDAGTHLRGMLAVLGLVGKGSSEKFVPANYRYNSEDVRWAVLQGILDTDGFVDKHGQPGIEQTSERLAQDIIEIVQSLGGTVLTRLREVNGYRDAANRFVRCKPVWRQAIRLSDAEKAFRLSRKRNLCRPKRKTGNRFFRSIEPSRTAEAQCIELSLGRQLYLTNGMVPTHNTIGCIVWLAEQAFSGSDGQNFWWVAPSQGQADIAFNRMLKAIPLDLRSESISLKTITLVNGAVVWFKSAENPDNLYGEDVYAAVFDEASRGREAAWHAVRSTLTATQGPIRIIGNVKGRKNWFYHLARKAESGDPNMGHHKLTAYDAVAAGVLDAGEVEDAKRILPDHVFRELYLAQPAADQGNPFGIDYIQKCATLTKLSGNPVAVWGWDFAKSQDWTVGIGLDQDGGLAGFHRFQKSWEETYDTVVRITGTTSALVDSTGVGDPILERLQKKPGSRFEGYTFSGPSKQKLMEGLQIAIQQQELRLVRQTGKQMTAADPGQLVAELEEFEYQYTRTGVRYSAPAGLHDDCVMALALAVMHKSHARAPMKISRNLIAQMGRRQ